MEIPRTAKRYWRDKATMRGKKSLDRIEAFHWISGIASTENLLLSLSFLQLVYFRYLFVLPQNRSRRLTTEDRFGSEANTPFH